MFVDDDRLAESDEMPVESPKSDSPTTQARDLADAPDAGVESSTSELTESQKGRGTVTVPVPDGPLASSWSDVVPDLPAPLAAEPGTAISDPEPSQPIVVADASPEPPSSDRSSAEAAPGGDESPE